MRARRQSGFTVIELMLVVVIVAIFATVMYGMTQSSVGGANPENVSNQIVSTMQLARMRAVSTRTWHRVEITPSQVTMWEAWNTATTAPQTGLLKPGSALLPATVGWKQVQFLSLPDNTTTVWNATTTIYASGGASVSQSTTLDFTFDFKPDGSSTGGTLFVTDRGQYKKWRVVVYTITGSSYARNGW